ncbi:Transposase DDE domain-containing protein [Alkalitalea saponilacus]|uniref:Transposase DDE domain-containing protein n=1 Tax=Alkalitalea saponilacus TaxID=889453 RepID=A0A1T5HSZ9_9BACT|nr:IS982 family transposase [Alkalitalea saponilacus]SKC23767.1 Transposase DDE domain-containing protein [Alkalitalea saponilacus]
MSQSEVITIMILFHYGAFKNMKHFYEHYVKEHLTREFPNTVSYNRFVELMQAAVLPMTLFLKTCCLGSCTGISFIDSTPIRVCKNKRIPRHKVFDGVAQRGKSTMGYFFGFKLHLVVNDKGEILNFVITPGNIDDREPLKDKRFIEKLRGKLYADKGYVSKTLTEILFVDGLHLITQIRNNMKNVLMEMKDKILLRKRSVIETINDELKNMCSIEHSRHRSFANFLTNMISALIAYSFFPKKPALKYEVVKTNQLTLF